MGGRLTGGAVAGSAGTTGFVSVTFQLGLVDRKLSRLTAELGVTESERRPAGHIGVRYDFAHDGPYTWTGSVAGEGGRDGGFGVVTAGIARQHATLTKETPDVLGGYLLGVALEGVVLAGGPDTSDIGVSIGGQLGLEVLWFALMR